MKLWLKLVFQWRFELAEYSYRKTQIIFLIKIKASSFSVQNSKMRIAVFSNTSTMCLLWCFSRFWASGNSGLKATSVEDSERSTRSATTFLTSRNKRTRSYTRLSGEQPQTLHRGSLDYFMNLCFKLEFRLWITCRLKGAVTVEWLLHL